MRCFKFVINIIVVYIVVILRFETLNYLMVSFASDLSGSDLTAPIIPLSPVLV